MFGWAATSLGLLWTNIFQQAVREQLDEQFSQQPDVERRFYSSPWLKWLLRKRPERRSGRGDGSGETPE